MLYSILWSRCWRRVFISVECGRAIHFGVMVGWDQLPRACLYVGPFAFLVEIQEADTDCDVM